MGRKSEKRAVSINVALSMIGTLITVFLLTFIGATLASSDNSSDMIIDGEFKIQPYELPLDEDSYRYGKYRHMTATVNEETDEVVLFGGITTVRRGWPPPSNNIVRTLDLTIPSHEQEWEERWEDARYPDGVVGMPWFTSASGFIKFDKGNSNPRDDTYYLTCDDQDDFDIIWGVEPEAEYGMTEISRAPDGATYQASDCCAVGVTMPGTKEERIYILGGRRGPSGVGPHPFARYYSITYGEWHQVADLNVGRSHLGCATVERKGEPFIYAISGGKSVSIDEGPQVFRSIEIYEIKKDKWEIYPDFLPEGKGRSRFGKVQNLDNKYLFLIGGDKICATGGGSDCPPSVPFTSVDVIDVKRNRLISEDNKIPQLKIPRHTPATALAKKRNGEYELYVIGGQTGIDHELGIDNELRDCGDCHVDLEELPQDDPYNHQNYLPINPENCLGCHPYHGTDILGTTEKLSFKGINVQNINDDDD